MGIKFPTPWKTLIIKFPPPPLTAKVSNARGMPGGGMLKLRFDRYIIGLEAHVRYVKILPWLRGFRVKIAHFSRLRCLAIPKRDLENQTKYRKIRKMTRKPRSRVKILMYRTLAIEKWWEKAPYTSARVSHFMVLFSFAAHMTRQNFITKRVM